MFAKALYNQTNYYKGKVRDVYTIGTNLLVMQASNRISAFDVVLPEPIPYKGQVLNQIASYMLQQTTDICPNWLLQTPTPTVSIGYKCEPIAIEMVIRGNLTGHAWRTYQTGCRTLCGEKMEDGLKENDHFATPIITPSTKATEGHDEDISAEAIIAKGIVSKADWDTLTAYTFALFERGKQLAAKQGLLLVDTKYEFGKIGETIYLMDEIHTPDSSRYFYTEGFEQRQQNGEKQKQLSKEFVREWLIANNFMGKQNQQVPYMSNEWITTISQRYIDLYTILIGKPFEPIAISDNENYELINEALQKLSIS